MVLWLGNVIFKDTLLICYTEGVKIKKSCDHKILWLLCGFCGCCVWWVVHSGCCFTVAPSGREEEGGGFLLFGF